jgi:uncharacterized protein YcfJ
LLEHYFLNMKLHTLTFALAASAVVLTGCVNPDGTQNNTGSGALIGGAFGAITGAVIGGPRNGGAGALIGAAAGAVGGGLIGNSMDQEQNARLRAQAPQTYTRVEQGQPLAVADVKALAKAGVSEDVITSQIQNSHTVYHLSAADIIDLRNSGVSDKVVNFMINTPGTAGENSTTTVIVQQAPPPPPVETVVIAPGPDFVWLGGEWIWSDRWVWRGGYWGRPPYGHTVWVGGRSWHDHRGWHNDHGHWR